MDVAVVLAGPIDGQFVPSEITAGVTRVVAADSGADLAIGLGLQPDAVVGDLDSMSAHAEAASRGRGAVIDAHPADKDRTDFELALEFALGASPRPDIDRPDRLIVLGGGSGRLDHLVANLGALAGAARRWPDVAFRGWLGATLVVPVVERVELSLDVGATVSAIAWGGPARLSSQGLRWTWRDEWLSPDEGRGVSNQVVGGVVEIVVHEGLAIVVVPPPDEVSEVRA